MAEFPTEIVEPLANRHDTTHVFNYLHRTLSAQHIPWTIYVPRHRTVVDPTPPEDDLVRIIPRDEFPSTGGWIDNIAEKIDHLVSSLPSNVTTGQQYQATKIPIPTPFSTTVPMFFPEADRPSLSTTPPFLTLSRSITDAVNIASLSENIGGPPETNSSSPCLLTYHAPCWIVRLLQHTVGLRPLPPPRLLCPTFPLSVYTFAVNPP